MTLMYLGVCSKCGIPMYHNDEENSTYTGGRNNSCKHRLEKKGNMVLRSLNLKKEQDAYLAERARQLGVYKGDYLRALIDEDRKIFATLPAKKKLGRPPKVFTAKLQEQMNE
jgi:hypothetical protein